ncbi:MAG TPA: Ig-like domain-containing protein [Flexivirga sp.]|uniref:L,D-transpeptidase n=1 Tax=Flexivirga sp. TaxID=1962927 RepID=UPI002C1210A1|nr:Ig-like domain-containing protein [Flexivirga sp.]HWC23815.1 Ig-like domain-containing protein [Flexivirga sp.]
MSDGLTRRVAMGGALATAVLAGAAACGDGKKSASDPAASGSATAGGEASASATAKPATVTAAGLVNGSVPFGAPVTLTASVRLRSLTVQDGDGRTVDGKLARSGTSWTSAGLIGPDVCWSWTAITSKGASSHGTVASTAATRTVRATANIGVDRTVGVAAPIVVNFSAQVTDNAAVEKNLQVLMRPAGSSGPWKPAVGSWAWLPDNAPNSTVHFRTKQYWPAHTEVHVILPLAHLDWGGGVTGVQDLDWHFNIGRSQIVVADARKHNIVIYRDGAKVATYPASYGLNSDPIRNTRSGINIVTDKQQTVEMKSKRYHYDEIEHWAVRFNNNGQFIHANPDTVEQQGKTNVSHGCINLSTANGKAYYMTAIYGDPVDVRGTKVKLADTRTELYDWALSWKQWTALSALH